MKRSEQGASPRNEAPQDFKTGFAGNEGAVSAPNYTTVVLLGIPENSCPRARLEHVLAVRLVADHLLDVAVHPALACAECCRPWWRCGCQVGMLRCREV